MEPSVLCISEYSGQALSIYMYLQVRQTAQTVQLARRHCEVGEGPLGSTTTIRVHWSCIILNKNSNMNPKCNTGCM